MGITYKGDNDNVINGFIIGYVFRGKVVGFVHSHTAYLRSDGSWDPIDYGPSATDKWLFNVPGIKRQFIVDELGNWYEFYK
jgi:hypothetical protein